MSKEQIITIKINMYGTSNGYSISKLSNPGLTDYITQLEKNFSEIRKSEIIYIECIIFDYPVTRPKNIIIIYSNKIYNF